MLVPAKDAYGNPPLTIECWTKLLSPNAYNVLVACKPKGVLDHWELFSNEGSGEFTVSLPGFSPAEIKSGVDIVDGAWHHVGMTFDGSRVELFIDGRIVKGADLQRKGGDGRTSPLVIGAIPSHFGCDGFIDEVRISSVIRKFSAVPDQPPEADEHTLALWRLDEVVGGRQRDFAPSARRETGQAAVLRRQQEAVLQELKDTEAEIKRRAVPQVFAGLRKQPAQTLLLLRGDIHKPGPAVIPAALSATHVLPGDLALDAKSPEGQRRLAFARWVTDARNPLTPRVIVNRLWQYHFGNGLVETPSDFGYSGGRPSHPELLDWLAQDLVRDGWTLKRLQRRMVCSATYRQRGGEVSEYEGARVRGSGDAKTTLTPSYPHTRTPQTVDADNRLLWRFAPRRLEAEIIRDAMLAASGELNTQMGGPSFKPFTVTVFNTHFYHLFDSGEPQYNRRTVYRACVNTGKSPLLTVLDCPAPSLSTPKRQETTTPLQALALMNDSFVQRQAEKMAAR
ncbi:MAG: DUF1553 domain-containing protein, partial [Pirellulaceae bacterium]